MAYRSRYKPTNIHKYKGRIDAIIARSSWERDFMYHLDHNPNVLEWASEEIIIPYISPLDSKKHRYFPDFWVKMKQKDGTIIEAIIEIKPHKETIEPKPPANPKRPGKRYAKSATKYIINEAKWNAAQSYCDAMGLEFKVLTEYDLYGKSGKKYAPRKKTKKKKSK